MGATPVLRLIDLSELICQYSLRVEYPDRLHHHTGRRNIANLAHRVAPAES